MSDMHFGEEDNLLTNLREGSFEIDPTKPSPVLKSLVRCLEYIINEQNHGKKPTLILNGDILELALTTTDRAAMAFERFIELTMKQGKALFEDILYVPGNHDHHLWETARETQYVNHLRTKRGKKLEPPRHTTNLFPENQKIMVQSFFLKNLIQRLSHLKKQDKRIHVFYPNLGLRSEDGKKSVLFTHGHYIESIYKLMTSLSGMLFPQHEPPLEIDALEAENFAWIDFFWSTMGRSGRVGRNVEGFYEKLQYAKGLKHVVGNLSESLAQRLDLPLLPEWAETRILNALIHRLTRGLAKRERSDTGSALGFKGESGLRDYVTGPLYRQVLKEIGTMPEEVTLVFGHTHKPFQKDMKDFTGYPRWVNVYNTGGWVVETVFPEPVHGAAVVLVDEELNATSLRMYNEAEDASQYVVRVDEARRGSEKGNPFYEEINGLVDPDKEPWRTFSETVAAAVAERAQNLHRRVKGLGYID
jgi:UDP-2,3-diacylglucosamine pyrophosphatase LpxH